MAKRKEAAEQAKSSPIEDMIRAAATNGELTYISLCAVAGKGPNGVSWSATYSPASKWGNGFGHADDPIEAMKLALTDTRLGKVVNDLHKTLTKVSKDHPLKARATEAAKGLGVSPDDSDLDFS